MRVVYVGFTFLVSKRSNDEIYLYTIYYKQFGKTIDTI